jgi:hypothetical protein
MQVPLLRRLAGQLGGPTLSRASHVARAAAYSSADWQPAISSSDA